MLKAPLLQMLFVAAISSVVAAFCLIHTDHFAYWPRFGIVFLAVAVTYSASSFVLRWLFQPLN